MNRRKAILKTATVCSLARQLPAVCPTRRPARLQPCFEFGFEHFSPRLPVCNGCSTPADVLRLVILPLATPCPLLVESDLYVSVGWSIGP